MTKLFWWPGLLMALAVAALLVGTAGAERNADNVVCNGNSATVLSRTSSSVLVRFYEDHARHEIEIASVWRIVDEAGTTTGYVVTASEKYTRNVEDTRPLPVAGQDEQRFIRPLPAKREFGSIHSFNTSEYERMCKVVAE